MSIAPRDKRPTNDAARESLLPTADLIQMVCFVKYIPTRQLLPAVRLCCRTQACQRIQSSIGKLMAYHIVLLRKAVMPTLGDLLHVTTPLISYLPWVGSIHDDPSSGRYPTLHMYTSHVWMNHNAAPIINIPSVTTCNPFGLSHPHSHPHSYPQVSTESAGPTSILC